MFKYTAALSVLLSTVVPVAQAAIASVRIQIIPILVQR
jgi:hypothetical protein